MAVTERDLPLGHPSSVDYDPDSPEAKEWDRVHNHPAGERDFPLGHPGAADNPDRVEPTNPLETARDFSRPHTIRKVDSLPAKSKPDGIHGVEAKPAKPARTHRK